MSAHATTALTRSIDLKLTVRSPFIMPGLEAGAFGVDAAALRDERKRPLIPADQIKGLLRAACVTLATVSGGDLVTREEIDALFGRPSPERRNSAEEQDIPARGALIFDDLAADDLAVLPPAGEEEKKESPGALKTITRVHIDPVTGAARTGHLYTVELVAALGEPVTFRGRVIVRLGGTPSPLRSADPAGWVAGLLDKAIKLIPAIGGLKSAGFGQVVDAATASTAILRPVEARSPAQPRAVGGSRRDYAVIFDRRLLVDAERLADNVWQGQAIIPGAVFKGALAERLKQAGANPESPADPEGRALAAIRITHAFPADGRQRRLMGMPLPLSLFVDDAPGLPAGADALMGGSPERTPRRQKRVPRFQPDWKFTNETQVRKQLSAGQETGKDDADDADDVAWLARMHVKIGKDYVAESGNLFVDVARSPLVRGDPAKPRHWHLTIHQGGADSADFQRFLAILETEGLDGVGATGAHATFLAEVPPVPRPSNFGPTRESADLWAVMLATPAMLLDPRDLQGSPPPKTLVQAYGDYWRETAGAELVNFYARQRLTGGYIAMRRRLYGKTYYPFLLTEPGSVFLLKGDLVKGDLGRRLETLLATGLPAASLRGLDNSEIPLSWRNCTASCFVACAPSSHFCAASSAASPPAVQAQAQLLQTQGAQGAQGRLVAPGGQTGDEVAVVGADLLLPFVQRQGVQQYRHLFQRRAGMPAVEHVAAAVAVQVVIDHMHRPALGAQPIFESRMRGFDQNHDIGVSQGSQRLRVRVQPRPPILFQIDQRTAFGARQFGDGLGLQIIDRQNQPALRHLRLPLRPQQR